MRWVSKGALWEVLGGGCKWDVGTFFVVARVFGLIGVWWVLSQG